MFIVLEIAKNYILEEINEMLVEKYCGKMYERGKRRKATKTEKENNHNPAW